MLDREDVFVICPYCKYKHTGITEDDYELLFTSTKLYTCRKCQKEFVKNMKVKRCRGV